ncbi:MAG: pseudouridine synthase, partial [Bacteroidota bacterium]
MTDKPRGGNTSGGPRRSGGGPKSHSRRSNSQGSGKSPRDNSRTFNSSRSEERSFKPKRKGTSGYRQAGPDESGKPRAARRPSSSTRKRFEDKGGEGAKGGFEKKRSFGDRTDKPRSFRKDGERTEGFKKRSFKKDEGRKFEGKRPTTGRQEDRKPGFKKEGSRYEGDRKFDRKPRQDGNKPGFRKDFNKSDRFGKNTNPREDKTSENKESGKRPRKIVTKGPTKNTRKPEYDQSKMREIARSKGRDQKQNTETRLNKFIANAGICSRREADSLIAEGQVKVNGKVVTEMGYKVTTGDVVKYQGKTLSGEAPVYLLLNKPKDFITTTSDPMERKTVMELVSAAGEERVFPVGRLDRATTGLLLFTNDGDLAEKLTHPSHKVQKLYEVTLDRPIEKDDFVKLQEGLTLEDGFAKPVDVAIVGGGDDRVLGMEIHMGRNRIVRRMMEHLGYSVEKL